jgi:predicted Ser/Thr protein kinase
MEYAGQLETGNMEKQKLPAADVWKPEKGAELDSYVLESPLSAGHESGLEIWTGGCRSAAGEKKYIFKICKKTAIEDVMLLEKQFIAMKKLKSLSGVARVYKKKEIHGYVYYIMDKVPGVTLMEWARGRDRESRVEVIGSVYAILDKVHRKGCYHGDLKPEHIYISESAKKNGSCKRDVRMIDFSNGTGWTPLYSPRNKVLADRLKNDFFALGLIIYEMISGASLSRNLPYRKIIETLKSISSGSKQLAAVGSACSAAIEEDFINTADSVHISKMRKLLEQVIHISERFTKNAG